MPAKIGHFSTWRRPSADLVERLRSRRRSDGIRSTARLPQSQVALRGDQAAEGGGQPTRFAKPCARFDSSRGPSGQIGSIARGRQVLSKNEASRGGRAGASLGATTSPRPDSSGDMSTPSLLSCLRSSNQESEAVASCRLRELWSSGLAGFGLGTSLCSKVDQARRGLDRLGRRRLGVPVVVELDRVLLDAKLAAPQPRPGTVSRAELIEVAQASDRRVVGITAPAGYGK